MSMDTGSDHSVKRPKHRSPSYPAIDLGKAVERAKQVERIAGRHAAPVSAVLKEWGYSPKSSNGLLAIAGLKKFGLVEDEGKGEARSLRLTTLGYELVFYDDKRGSAEWLERAREAAFKPRIHAELWAKYSGNLPGDGVISPHLVLERKFSQEAAKEVLREFRATLIFARIEMSEVPSDLSDDDAEDDQSQDESRSTTNHPSVGLKALDHQGDTGRCGSGATNDVRTVQVPYSLESWAILQAAFPLKEAEWTQMIAVLEAMKPGLVRDE